MNRLLFTLILISGFGCSLEVKKASVETSPPKAQPGVFKASQLFGELTASSTPTMFLWPISQYDDLTGQLIPLSFAGQVEVRSQIAAYSDDIDLYTAKYEAAQKEIDEKYDLKAAGLVGAWKEKVCFSYCDPDDFFCDPTDETVEFVDVWKSADDPVEAPLIQACQNNQQQRKNLNNEKKAEEEQRVLPAREKAGQASLAILQTVGDRNLFLDSDQSHLPVLGAFSLKTGQYSCSLISNGCFPWQEFGVYIELTLSGQRLSNYEGEDKRFLIREVVYDQVGGFLSFKVPFRDKQSDDFLGFIFFDLEVKEAQGKTRLDGDIRMQKDGVERVGRFSLTGQVKPIDSQSKLVK
jgi:hypothetical protein